MRYFTENKNSIFFQTHLQYNTHVYKQSAQHRDKPIGLTDLDKRYLCIARSPGCDKHTH